MCADHSKLIHGKYFVTCLDNYTYVVMVYLITNKYEVSSALKNYIKEIALNDHLLYQKFDVIMEVNIYLLN